MIGRRIGDPFARLEDTIKKNPLGADRQRTDLKVLSSQNRNPRVHDLTPADLARSQTFSPQKEDPAVTNEKIIQLKAEAFCKATDWSFADSLKKIKADIDMRSSSTSILSPQTDRTAAFEIYKNTISSKAPVTFGHRPGSASRMVNPRKVTEPSPEHTEVDSKGSSSSSSSTVKEAKQKGSLKCGTGMSSKLLYNLLNQRPYHKNNIKQHDNDDRSDKIMELQQPPDQEHKPSKYCNVDVKPSHDSSRSHQQQGNYNFELGQIDSSLYKVWKDCGDSEWDQQVSVHNNDGQDPIPQSRNVSAHQRKCGNKKPPETKRTQQSDRRNTTTMNNYEPFSNFSRPPWKVKVDQCFPPTAAPQKTTRGGSRPSVSSREVRSILQEQAERTKELDRRVKVHEQLVQRERVDRIKDRLTMPSHWERIMECR